MINVTQNWTLDEVHVNVVHVDCFGKDAMEITGPAEAVYLCICCAFNEKDIVTYTLQCHHSFFNNFQ